MIPLLKITPLTGSVRPLMQVVDYAHGDAVRGRDGYHAPDRLPHSRPQLSPSHILVLVQLLLAMRAATIIQHVRHYATGASWRPSQP